MSAPLSGLVLAGGRSQRMQRDKAGLSYHGGTQLEWAMGLVSACVEQAFVSVRADQRDDAVRARFAQIVDRDEDLGPIAGIFAAQAAHPTAAWLVVACDLPFLDAATLEHLVWARQSQRNATAYRSSHDGLPEPLCAIYEPSSNAALERFVRGGGRCPRKFLLQADAALLDEPDPRALDNVNTPEEYRAAMQALNRTALTINVQYYALLREQAGRSEETLATVAGTPRELYAELGARYPFSLAPQMLRVAVNAEFADWERPLAEHDTVVFIPPVAGG